MTVTSYTLPGTAINADRDTSKVGWSDPENVKTDDSNYADSNDFKGDYGDWLRVTNFGFSIPDSTINGIEITINRAEKVGGNAIDDALYLRKTSGQVGDNFASATEWTEAPPTVETYGGATELFGTTWTYSEINSSDFGLDLSVYGDGGQAGGWVYYIKIRIYYTITSDAPVTEEEKKGGGSRRHRRRPFEKPRIPTTSPQPKPPRRNLFLENADKIEKDIRMTMGRIKH